jgi:galactose mutarotase-like enzyme
MMVSISNHVLSASFATKGAELQSLLDKNTVINYLWSGDANYWGKFSPVLFPIVGALKNNTYTHNGQNYELARHGFARDMEFAYEKLAEDEILFTLTHNVDTLKNFPFAFQLNLRYKLANHTLFCTYEVINPAQQNLFFSVGGHPAFAVPLTKNTTFEDYFLQLNNDEKLSIHQISGGLVCDETTSILLNQGKLGLNRKLFYTDALVFKALKSDTISLLNTQNKHGLHFNFKGFPYFGIWAAKDANFVCLEPWCGIADGINHTQELTKKEGINCLPPNGFWQRTWSITCF